MGFLDTIANLLNKESFRNKQVSISIEVLSEQWRKYNHNYMPAIIDDDEIIENPEMADEIVSTDTDNRVNTNGSSNTSLKTNELLPPGTEYYTSLLNLLEHHGFNITQYKDALQKTFELIDSVGNCPSVVKAKKVNVSDLDVTEFRPDTYTLLGKITLKEHLLNTASSMVRLAAIEYDVKTPVFAMLVFSALFHDIGKALEIRGNSPYASSDHPIISADFATAFLKPYDFPWLLDMDNAIRLHHEQRPESRTAQLLKEADAMARQIEVARLTSWKITSQEHYANWLDVKDFINTTLLPVVNVEDENGKWNAISSSGYVYVEPRILYKLVQDYLAKHQLVDIRFIKQSFYESAIQFLLTLLYKEKVIKNPTPRQFRVKFSNKIINMVLVEMRIQAFNVKPSELESRKSGLLKTVHIV